MSNETTALPKRDQVKKELTWDLEDIFATDEAWEQEFFDIKEMVPQLGEFKGRLGESAETLYELLQLKDEISVKLGRLYTYAHMRYDQDTTNSFYQGLNDRASQLLTMISNAASFVTPELLSIAEET